MPYRTKLLTMAKPLYASVKCKESLFFQSLHRPLTFDFVSYSFACRSNGFQTSFAVACVEQLFVQSLALYASTVSNGNGRFVYEQQSRSEFWRDFRSRVSSIVPLPQWNRTAAKLKIEKKKK